MIVVADDELELRRTLRALLTRSGFAVETCSNGAEALQVLEKAAAAGEPAKLLLTDIRMPGGSGLDLLRAVRARWPQLPVVVMTAYGERDVLRELIGLGCDGLLEKPFDPKRLFSVLEAALARAGGTAETNDWRDPGPPETVRIRTRTCPYSFGKYELVELIDRGAAGSVYRARQLDLGRPVALKFVNPTVDALAAQHEAQALARLRHSNIPVVYECGRHDGADFIAMELIEGYTLRARLARQGPLAPEEAVRLLVPVADALSCAHQHGVLHRDVKPANIVIDETGRAVLVDFGVALCGKDEDSDLQGTPPYMAPEYIHGEPYDAACDAYSFGLVLYEALTGLRVLPRSAGSSDIDDLRRFAELIPIPVTQLAPHVDLALARIVHRLIAPRATRLSLDQGLVWLRRWLESEVEADATLRH